MSIPHERMRWPTLTHAVYVVGEMESRRRWLKDGKIVYSVPDMELLTLEECNGQILDLVDWAACDVDVAELKDFIDETRRMQDADYRESPSMAELVGSREFVNAASILWDVMSGPNDPQDVVRWLFIERCHEARFNCKLMSGVPDDTCPRCLTLDQAPDPGCTVCRRKHRIRWEWEGDPGEGAEGDEGQDLRATA